MIYRFNIDFCFTFLYFEQHVILIIYGFSVFYSMVDKCIMNQWQQFLIFCGNIHRFYQHYQPAKINLQVSVLMIEYLVATSYELWMM